MFNTIKSAIACTLFATATLGSSALLGSSSAIAAPDPFDNKFENYQCYKVLKDGFKMDKDRTVDVADQFEKYRQFAIKPVLVCNPVSINGEKVKNPEVHLVCFSTDPAGNGGFKEKQVYLKNRFGEGDVVVEKVSQLLCVTSIKKH